MTADLEPRDTPGHPDFDKSFGGYMRRAQKPRTVDVLGREIARPSLDDIAPGHEVFHATLRWLSGEDYDPKSGDPIGKAKGGAVVDVYEVEGRRTVTVIEPVERRSGRDVEVLRWDWPVNELDPTRIEVLSDARITKYVIACLRYALTRGRRFWDYAEGDLMVAAVLALTQRGRDARAAAANSRSASCVGGHCVDDGGDCSEARSHIGICCHCSATVQPRKAAMLR